MRFMFITDLLLALDDLQEKRINDVRSTAAGRLYEPMIVRASGQLVALPEAIRAAKPLADELSAADVDHDGFGSALWYFTEGYFRAPSTPPEIIEACKRIRHGFIPALQVLKKSYATEAAAALKRQPTLEDFRADLEMFPLAPSGTLFDWASSYIECGIKLHQTLSNRADVGPEVGGEAGLLRGSTIGLLNRFRSTLADELAGDPSLPRDLDTKIFAYFDELNANREAAQVRRAVAKQPVNPPQPLPTWGEPKP